MTEEELIAFRDSPHMPNDVPDHLLADMADILARIPRGWGKWISCDAGWYPLIADLNRKLAALDPDYEVHQCKEKFAGLRYYFGLSPLPELPCCEAFYAENPYPKSSWTVSDPREAEYHEAYERWANASDAHELLPEHVAGREDRRPLEEARHEAYDRMEELVTEAERLSEKTCETCGREGSCHTSNGGWLKTLCPSCADPERWVTCKKWGQSSNN